MDKLYSAEDLEIGKYYIRGGSRVYKLMERTDKIFEHHTDQSLSKVYKFEIFTLDTGTWDYIDMALKTNHTCFTDFNDFYRKIVKDMIWQKKRHLESLEMLLK